MLRNARDMIAIWFVRTSVVRRTCSYLLSISHLCPEQSVLCGSVGVHTFTVSHNYSHFVQFVVIALFVLQVLIFESPDIMHESAGTGFERFEIFLDFEVEGKSLEVRIEPKPPEPHPNPPMAQR